MNSPSKIRRRGLATLWALALLTLMSATLVIMSLVFTAQLRRTQAASTGAQIRELLAAAIPLAQQELTTRGPAPRTINIPVPLPETTLTLTVTQSPAGEAQIIAAATFKNKKGAEKITFTPAAAPGTWTLKETRLTLSP